MRNSVFSLREGRLFVVFLLTLSACDKEVVKAREMKLEPTLQSIQSDFVNVRCLSCHTTATPSNRNVGLADIREVMEKSGHDHGSGPHPRILIKPGCPKQSFFLSIMREGKMPPAPAPRVSGDEMRTIENFIVGLDPKAGKICDDEPPDR